jgi:two-component system, NtrC family, response regulator HydG
MPSLKVLLIGRDTEIQNSVQGLASEIFVADDLNEAKSILDNIDVDTVLIESIFCPASIKEFFNSTLLGKKGIIIGAKNNNKASEADCRDTGAAAYLADSSNLTGLSNIIKNISNPAQSNDGGFFLNNFAASIPIAGKSTSIGQTLKMIELVGLSNCNPVLILGQTGTGKESAAKAIHCIRHPDKPFVAVNCAALTANLLESELFGHVKGAFTSADKEKTGLLELAADGTLFLDEISEIPLELQAKLLRVFQEKTFRKVGGLIDIKCDAMIITSSNRDLKTEVAEKRFRQDLYYRLIICPVVLAPLNSEKRRQDIPLLAEYFLATSTIHPEKTKKIRGFTPLAIKSLMQHNWPGNIRELKNVIERAILLEAASHIGMDSIIIDPTEQIDPAEFAKEAPSEKLKDFTLVAAEKELIKRALVQTSGQKSRAANLLGITRATLYAKLKQYDIEDDSACSPCEQNSEELINA